MKNIENSQCYFPELYEGALDSLRESIKADLLTCHIYDGESKLFWLFHRSGDFKCEGQMCGPLTTKHQADRMTYREDHDVLLEVPLSGGIHAKVHIFENPKNSKELAGQILHGDSFINREDIKKCIRILIKEISGDTVNVIFLNYRSDTHVLHKNEIENILKFSIPHLCHLAQWSSQVSLHEGNLAWKLCSNLSNLRNKFGQIKMTQSEDWSKFWTELVGTIKNLIEFPDGSKILTCDLYEVKRDGSLELLHDVYITTEKEDKNPGVVEYVARTAQVYYIPDTNKYSEAATFNPLRRPEYVECTRGVNCELACPLLVGSKVVGVLNLESDGIDVYSNHMISLIYSLSTFVATTVREAIIWRDLLEITRHSRELFGLNEHEEMLKKTLSAVKSMGYKCGIWEFDESEMSGRWVEGSEPMQNNIRTDGQGFTNWIRENSKAFLVADYSVDATQRPRYKQYIGKIGESRLFEKWVDDDGSYGLTNITPSEDIDRVFIDPEESKRRGDVVCDIGFPIIEDNLSYSSNSDSEVVAVLWAKCKRHSVSILNDEIWFISLICRTVGEARQRLKERQAAEKEKLVYVRDRLYNYHFGPSRAKSIIKIGENTEGELKGTLLKAIPVDEVVVINVDIRGSTEFSSKCNENRQPDKFVEFILEYQNICREAVIEMGGVFDKTIGDGAMGIFNVFNEKVIDSTPHDTLNESYKNAINAGFMIINRFTMLVEKIDSQLAFTLSNRFGVGIGIVCGKGHVGSTVHKDLAGFEYTVYGEAANLAGKIVSLADARLVREWMQVNRAWSVDQNSRESEEVDANRGEALEFLEKDRQSILLCLARDRNHICPNNADIIQVETGQKDFDRVLWIRERGK